MFKNYYNSASSGQLTALLSREWFFLFGSSVFFKAGLSATWLISTYVFLSLSLKFYLMAVLSRRIWVSLVFFSAYFLLMMDGMVIRAALAVSVVYMLYLLLLKNYWLLYCLGVVVSALLFHFSVIIFLPLVFFYSYKQAEEILLILLSLAALSTFFAFHDGLVNVFDSLNAQFVHVVPGLTKAAYYLRMAQADGVGLFDPKSILALLSALLLFVFRYEFSAYERLCYLTFLVSLIVFFLLKEFPIVQSRLVDMLGFSFVFLVPILYRISREFFGRYFAGIGFVTVCALLFYEHFFVAYL